MRGLWIGALAAAGIAALTLAPTARAQETQAAPWTARAEALARRIQQEHLIVDDRVLAARAREAGRVSGRARLQILYDLAAEDYVASNAARAALSLAALEREAARQQDRRFARMIDMLRAYAPALDGDFLTARRNLEAALQGEADAYVIAAGARFRSYCLTDLGLVGNALEAARQGLLQLPETADARTLRSGLHDALAYTSVRIGDAESGLDHLARSVELDTEAGKPIDGLTIIYNVASMLADSQTTDTALRIANMHREIASRSVIPADRFFANLLCAKVNFAAHNFGAVVRCANAGRAVEAAPREYITRLLVYRAGALARLGHGGAARQALDELRAIAAQRGDPALSEKIDALEPEVLHAEGRVSAAYVAMRDNHDLADREVLSRFNSGVKELRATMESEIALADERAEQEAVRAQLRGEIIQFMTLAVILAGLGLAGAIAVATAIYRSRRTMMSVVERAEAVLAQQNSAAATHSQIDRTGSNVTRLTDILNEIERRDLELKHGFAALEAARAAADEANLAKSRFLTTMSHELRTPLNAIIGYSELLMENAEDSGAANDSADLRKIRGAGCRLLVMVNDLLDLSKIEAGHMAVEAEEFELKRLLDEVLATVAPSAAASGNDLRFEIEPSLGAARTDAFKLSQCLLNLLSNAIKFTAKGEVRFIARREAAEDGDWCVFEVIDTGIGISPEVQAQLFQPFVQADPSITRTYGGTGLGLAITRRLARLLGGDVSLKSELGKGAAFILRVPADLAANAGGQAERQAA